MMPAIAYTRLSKPNKKGKPGVGLDAQQAAIATVAKAEGYDLVEIFSEVETGEGSDALEKRPQLAAAMKLATKTVELGQEILDWLKDLLKGAAAPIYMAIDA